MSLTKYTAESRASFVPPLSGARLALEVVDAGRPRIKPDPQPPAALLDLGASIGEPR
jgi:hypothetical protein